MVGKKAEFKEKKGQVTIFFILGLLLLIFVLIFLFISSSALKSPKTNQLITPISSENITLAENIELTPTFSFANHDELETHTIRGLDSQIITQLVDSCLEDSFLTSIYLIAEQGGIINPTSKSILTDNGIIEYHYYNEEIIAMSLDEIMNNLLYQFESDIFGCTIFDSNAQELIVTEPKISLEIKRNELEIIFNNEILLEADTHVTTISSKKYVFPTNLAQIIDIRDELLEQYKSDREWINPLYLSDLDFLVTYVPYDEETSIFIIQDEEEIPMIYKFAVKNEIKTPPSLNFIPDMLIKKGNMLEHLILAQNPYDSELFYYCESEYCTIDEKEPKLYFSSEQKGSHTIIVKVKNTEGASTEQEVTIHVI